MLWHDRRGRFSYLRAATLALLIAPALALLYFALTGDLGPRPRTEAIHEAGLWSIRFLMLALLITPLRRLARYPLVIDVRRMIGVASFLYIALHLFLYIADEMYDLEKVVSEIVLRWYLVIGATAWVGLAILAATSNDYMLRKLGAGRWNRLHWLIYPIGLLALIHYFMQSKLEVFEPTVVGGLFLWMMLYRLAHWTLPRRFFGPSGELHLWLIAALGVAASALTFLGEAYGLALVHHISANLVLAADFSFRAGFRPGWYVLAGGMILFLIGALRMIFPPRPRQRTASSSAGRTPS